MPIKEPALRAVIYMQGIYDDCPCYDHSAAMGYRLVGTILDRDGSRWLEVIEGLLSGQYEVVVRCPLDPLPVSRVPRVEDARPPAAGNGSWQRRPQPRVLPPWQR